MTIKCDICRCDSWFKELKVFMVSLNLKPVYLKRKTSFYIPSLFIKKKGLKIVFWYSIY